MKVSLAVDLRATGMFPKNKNFAGRAILESEKGSN